MFDIVVFAGTTEGCEICSFLAKNKVSVLACVATDYGSKSLKEGEYLKIHAGRLNGEEMENLLKELSPGLVLDATHPYAAEVTENIRAACQNTGFSYQRVLREKPVLIRIRLFMWRHGGSSGVSGRYKGKYPAYHRQQRAWKIYSFI
ncbi:MAG: precorrin-6A/cobalt-precorrin-6A reductase [Ruminococcus sp.]